MITREKFVEVLERRIIQEEKLETLSKAGFPIWDTEVVEYGNQTFMDLLGLVFDEDGIDIITWWLWELGDHSEPSMWDKDGNVIPLDAIEDLWNAVQDYLL